MKLQNSRKGTTVPKKVRFISVNKAGVASEKCKCQAPPKPGLAQLTEDYNSLADFNYEYSFGENYGVLRDIQELRHMRPSKMEKKVFSLDEESRKKSLEVEHEKKILAIKKKDVEQSGACNEHYGCRCQSKMLAPLSLDDLLARRIGCRILEFEREVDTKKKFVIPRMNKLLTPAPKTGGFNPEKTKIFVDTIRQKLNIIQKDIPDILQAKEDAEMAEYMKREMKRLQNPKNFNSVRLPPSPTNAQYAEKLLRRKMQVMKRCRKQWRDMEAAEELAKRSKYGEEKLSDSQKDFLEKCLLLESDKKFKRIVAKYIRNLPKISSEENLKFFLKHYPKMRTLSERVAKYTPADQTDQDKLLEPKKFSRIQLKRD